MSILKYGEKDFFANRVQWIRELIDGVNNDIEFFGIKKLGLNDKKRNGEFYKDIIGSDMYTTEDFDFVLSLSEEEKEKFKKMDMEFYVVWSTLECISDIYHTALLKFLGEEKYRKLEDTTTALPIEDLYRICKDKLNEYEYTIEDLKAAVEYDKEDRYCIFKAV